LTRTLPEIGRVLRRLAVADGRPERRTHRGAVRIQPFCDSDALLVLRGTELRRRRAITRRGCRIGGWRRGGSSRIPSRRLGRWSGSWLLSGLSRCGARGCRQWRSAG